MMGDAAVPHFPILMERLNETVEHDILLDDDEQIICKVLKACGKHAMSVVPAIVANMEHAIPHVRDKAMSAISTIRPKIPNSMFASDNEMTCLEAQRGNVTGVPHFHSEPFLGRNPFVFRWFLHRQRPIRR